MFSNWHSGEVDGKMKDCPPERHYLVVKRRYYKDGVYEYLIINTSWLIGLIAFTVIASSVQIFNGITSLLPGGKWFLFVLALTTAFAPAGAIYWFEFRRWMKYWETNK